ncbi:MAG: CoA activase, partial [Acidobacteriota bacterium]
MDFIESRFKGKDVQPNIFVHKHTGESGAIGAALEAARLYDNGHRTGFIGLDAVEAIEYTTTRDENTRCYFCKNKCLRTFIDVKTARPPSTEEAFLYKMGAEEPRAARIRRRADSEISVESIEASAAAQTASDTEQAAKRAAA